MLTIKDFLKLSGINAYYNEFQALFDIDMRIEHGGIVGVLGANGAGKTTLLKTIAGITTYKGSIEFDGQKIDSFKPYQRVKCGIVYLPEGKSIFDELTVEENLKLASKIIKNSKQRTQRLESVYEIFPFLKERSHQLAKTLSGGERRMLGIARALIYEPKILMIDELSLGLAPIVASKLFISVKDINKKGVTVLLADQRINDVIRICDELYVLRRGKIILQGNPRELTVEEIQKAYFGEAYLA